MVCETLLLLPVALGVSGPPVVLLQQQRREVCVRKGSSAKHRGGPACCGNLLYVWLVPVLATALAVLFRTATAAAD